MRGPESLFLRSGSRVPDGRAEGTGPALDPKAGGAALPLGGGLPCLQGCGGRVPPAVCAAGRPRCEQGLWPELRERGADVRRGSAARRCRPAPDRGVAVTASQTVHLLRAKDGVVLLLLFISFEFLLLSLRSGFQKVTLSGSALRPPPSPPL